MNFDQTLIISKVMRKIHIPVRICKKFNLNRHNSIMKCIKKDLELAQQYLIHLNENLQDECSNIIWVFWWQGEQNMPLIVKTCYNSLIKYARGIKVKLITKENIKKYTKINEEIYDKIRNNQISLTHFSDILRFNLLRHYGGLWTDATVLWTDYINKQYFQKIYTSGGYGDKYLFSVTEGKWTSFLIGGVANNELFVFMDEFFNIYWKHHDKVVDYFLMDYALYYAYKNNIGDFADYVNNQAINNNPNLFSLAEIINEKYDKNKMTKILEKTNAFKLSYKKNYKKRNTFADKIFNNNIEI